MEHAPGIRAFRFSTTVRLGVHLITTDRLMKITLLGKKERGKKKTFPGVELSRASATFDKIIVPNNEALYHLS